MADTFKPATLDTVQKLKLFLAGTLRWGIANGQSTGDPSIIVVNADGNSHCVDPNATYLVSMLNFRNRPSNSGTLLIGANGNQTISIGPGVGVSPPWTTPARWFYTVTGGATGDVYEIWWSG